MADPAALAALTPLADDLGVLGIAELHQVGLGPAQLRRLVRAGELSHLRRGWYAVSSPASPEQAHLQRLRAVERTYAGTAVASHHSELLRLELPIFDADLSVIHLSRRDPQAQHRHHSRVMVHRAPPPEAFLPTGRIHPALAVVQHGLTSSGSGALCAADSALHQSLVTAGDLEQAVAWVGRHPRSAHIRSFIRFADGRSESVGETRLRHALHLVGIRTTPQVTISDGGFTARVDLLVDGSRVVIEFDGAMKYAGDTGRDALVAEKWREDRLRELGFTVLRVVWRELGDVSALERRVRAAILRAA